MLLFTGNWYSVYSQSGSCDPATPFYAVDLSANPNSSWTSPSVSRIDHCCGVTGTARCVEFLVTLSPAAVAVSFDIASGAPATGWFYQVNCGAQIAMGTPICLSGPGPYTITFCKPGANPNTYKVTSISGPSGPPDQTVGNGCNITMATVGLITSSITWNSIFPGASGAYNSYLSCSTACASTAVTAQPSHPPYVDYRVCGTPAASLCAPPGQFCDTVRVYMATPLLNTINPNPASFCANNPSVLLTGIVNGGIPPYTYAWTNAANGAGTIVGTGLTYTATSVGNYSFLVYDQNYPSCPVPAANVTVTSTPVPVVNAGPDKTSCGTSLTLNGSITGAIGGIWTGGSGTFSAGNTSLTTNYTPTASELASGIVVLTLTSTGNGSCSAVSDQVVLHVSAPISVTISSPPIICFGQTATLTANVSGGVAPFTYLWNTGETTQTLSNVGSGTHSVTVTGASPSFCTGTASKTLNVNSQIIVTTSPNNSISCSTTATISASATGGNGISGYTWSWSNGATTSSTNVNTGTYTVLVTDGYGCTASNSVSVTAGSTLVVTVNQPSVLCNGATTSLTATATGGLGGNTYLWSNGSNALSINVGTGNYCVTVTDAGGCIASACAPVTQKPALVVSIPTPSTICNGTSATVNASVSGGQAPYTYLWNTGTTTQSLVAPAGTYSVTVTDFIGCTKVSSVTISQAALLSISMSTTGVSCFGGSNGSATAAVSGGTSAYFYSWSPSGGSSATATGLVDGTYSVTVTDMIGCTANATVNVTEPLVLAASITLQNQVSCNGGNDGAAIVNPTGGTAPYTYGWNPNAATIQNVTNLSAGSYTVTVTDFKGCTAIAQTIITEPPLLTASIVSITDVSCNAGSNGGATILASGGTLGYLYSWAPSGGTNPSASSLAAGTYTVTVTDSKSCTIPVVIVINQPLVLTSAISNSTNISCNGGNNGTATVNPAGGTSPYTYAWNTNPVQTTATASNLSAGTYSVTVTDSKNCVTTSPGVNIIAPTLLTVTASPATLISCSSTISISSVANGGTGAYTYLWNTGAATSAITVNTGTYIITVTDAAGCIAKDTVSVLASNSTLTSTINQPSNLCYNGSTSITVVVTGGLGGNSYLWNTGATTASIPALAGTYCVTVTDVGGCITNSCVTVIQNPQIGVTIATPPLICPGATTTLTAVGTGGQQPYSYLWNSGQTTQSIVKPAGTYTVTISDVTGNTCSAIAGVTVSEVTPIQTTMSHTNISCFGSANGSATVYASGGASGYTYSWAPAGGTGAVSTLLGPQTYTVTVTDAIGCVKTDNVIITQPASAVGISLTKTNIICFGDSTGTATAVGSGGVPPYYYLWSVVGDTLATITGLKANTYIATVADNTGCLASGTVVISEPPELTLAATVTQIVCFGGTGSVSLTSSGGTGTRTITGDATTNLIAGTYTYTVTDGNGCSKTIQAVVNPSPGALTLTATVSQINCFGGTGSVSLSSTGGLGALVITGNATTNLTAGTYNYTITDSTGCTGTASAIINAAPSAVVLSATASQIACLGGTGSVTLVASGGTGTYTITGNATVNLVAGTYNYAVTDANGCTANASATINAGPAAAVSLSAVSTQITCFGGTGSVALTASGGTGTLTITGAAVTALVAGTYNYTVTDANGCTATTSATINPAPSAVVLTAVATQIPCFGGVGSVALTASGGTGALVTSGDATTGLVAGTYNYLVTDSKGCTAAAQATINAEPSVVVLTATASQINCFGGTGSVLLVPSGGTGTFTITGDATTNLIAGTYNYTVTDIKGCTANASAIINAGPSTAVSLSATAAQITCFGGSGSVALTASGGTGTLTISGDATINLVAGTYNYTVTDANGCSANASATINAAPPAVVLAASANQIPCFGGTGSVVLTSSGGTGTLTITGDAVTGLFAGTYNYLVTDSQGCTAPAQAVINTAPAVLSAAITPVQITCFGLINGTAAVVATGGTAPFNYSWQNGETTSTITGLAVGTYSLAIVDDRGCGTSASTAISAPAEIILGETTVPSSCGNNNGAATVTATGGTGGYTYAWQPFVGTVATASSLFSGDYTVTVTDSNFCQQQIALTVGSSSFLMANFGATSACINSPIVFTDSSSASPGSITSWEWDFGNSTVVNTAQNPVFGYSASGIYNVSLIVASSNGCTDTIVKPVTVYASPSADFVSSKVCLGFSTVFTDQSVAPAGGSITGWTWNFGDSLPVVTLQNTAHTYLLPGIYNSSLVVVSNNGCMDTATVSTLVYSPPVAQFVVNDSSGCRIHCGQFTNTSTTLSGTITAQQWDFGDATTFGVNSLEEHCYLNPGTYSVSLTVTSSLGCVSTVSQSNLITVYDVPQAEFGYTPHPPTSIASEIYFDNLSIGASEWLWDFGDPADITSSVLEYPTHNYANVGNYCITLYIKNLNQCLDSIVHCLDVEPEFTFFIPNAFSPFDSPGDNDGFSGYGTNISNYDMWIFDRWGNMIFHTDDLNKKWDGKANYGKDMAQRDVYVYLVELLDFRGKPHKYRGTVTLVR